MRSTMEDWQADCVESIAVDECTSGPAYCVDELSSVAVLASPGVPVFIALLLVAAAVDGVLRMHW